MWNIIPSFSAPETMRFPSLVTGKRCPSWIFVSTTSSYLSLSWRRLARTLGSLLMVQLHRRRWFSELLTVSLWNSIVPIRVAGEFSLVLWALLVHQALPFLLCWWWARQTLLGCFSQCSPPRDHWLVLSNIQCL